MFLELDCAYIDDVVIFSESVEICNKYLKSTRKLFELLKEKDFKYL